MLKLRPSSLDWAIEHVKRFADTDVLPLPFEYFAIEHAWPEIKSYLVAQDVLNWRVRAHRTLLAPKSRYAFRVVTQLDPLDFLVFAALIREMAKDIEGIRVPVSQKVVFSYRLLPATDGQLFDPAIGYDSFLKRIKNKGVTP